MKYTTTKFCHFFSHLVEMRKRKTNFILSISYKRAWSGGKLVSLGHCASGHT